MTAKGNDELDELIKTVKSKPRMILYTDVIGWSERGEQRDQTGRDDLWAISTSEIEAIKKLISKREAELLDRLAELYDAMPLDYEVALGRFINAERSKLKGGKKDDGTINT